MRVFVSRQAPGFQCAREHGHAHSDVSTLPQQHDVLGQGVVALFGDATAQVLFVPGQMGFDPAAVRFGVGRTGATKVPPQLLDRFQVHLEYVRNFDWREFPDLTGRTIRLRRSNEKAEGYPSSLLLLPYKHWKFAIKVRSVTMSISEYNYVLNPAHPDFARISFSFEPISLIRTSAAECRYGNLRASGNVRHVLSASQQIGHKRAPSLSSAQISF